MNQNIIIFLFLLSLCKQIEVKMFNVYYPEIYYGFRNTILKKIIYEDKRKVKTIIQQTKIAYNKILSTFYDYQSKYYELSESDQLIIETMLSLNL
jgi:hypothetical protein